MAGMVESYLKFNYAVRPAKQVERKLLLEAFLKLTAEGYPICDYTYLGFGSVYYADFLVFNRYLYMDNMICVEGGDIPRRMDFNKPLGDIQLEMSLLSDVIPTLDRDQKYLAWLDYDIPLDETVLSDIRSLIYVLAPGSILLVTVDAEARVRHEAPLEDKTGDQIRAIRVGEINEAISMYLDEPVTLGQYNNRSLPGTYATALANAIQDGVTSRGDVEFAQLFNFRYRDGAQMLSMGGVIDVPERITELRSGKLCTDWQYLNASVEPVEIRVPPLTPREKQHLDKWATSPDPRDDLPFELDEELLTSFERFRRYYPQYVETIV